MVGEVFSCYISLSNISITTPIENVSLTVRSDLPIHTLIYLKVELQDSKTKRVLPLNSKLRDPTVPFALAPEEHADFTASQRLEDPGDNM